VSGYYSKRIRIDQRVLQEDLSPGSIAFVVMEKPGASRFPQNDSFFPFWPGHRSLSFIDPWGFSVRRFLLRIHPQQQMMRNARIFFGKIASFYKVDEKSRKKKIIHLGLAGPTLT
jgi:hypothetical protein